MLDLNNITIFSTLALPRRGRLDLAFGNATLARFGLADIMERVVVGGRNAIKFKGPQAAENLAAHEKSNREGLEFWQSDYWSAHAKQMQAEEALHDAKLAAGLYTAEELEFEKPTIYDLFTAEELKQYPESFRACMLSDNPQLELDKVRKLYEEAARRTPVWLEDRKAKALQSELQ